MPLYFAAERPVVERDGALIMVDDDRMRLLPGETPQMRKVRLSHPRLLSAHRCGGERGRPRCPGSSQEMLLTTTSERQGLRVIDHDQSASMEKKKREGYF